MAAASPIQKNLDQYLTDVANFIDIKPNDYKKAKAIFESVFKQLKTKMEDKCNYFKAYSTEVLYAGSVYDKIKITKLDEFDMDIVIKLPVNYEEIEFENYAPGFVCMKITELERLKHQKNWELRHKVTSFWRDNEHYFLQNKFRDWIHSVVEKALGDLNYRVTVGDVTYMVAHRESGPASTFNIRNLEGDEEFTLDVDLVPVIRFMRPRWPPGMYRSPREQDTFDWLVVPKPNKSLPDGEMRNRCWRLSFQDYERNMMKGCYQLKPTIRLVKKLRDSLQMKNDIASYYIKTLFLWEIHETKDKKYWKKLSETFRVMVKKLLEAVQEKKIPYFWHKEYNLIENVRHTVLDKYADNLKNVLDSIDRNDADKVVSYLLNANELKKFEEFKIEKQSRNNQQGSAESFPSAYETPTFPMSRHGSIDSLTNHPKYWNPVKEAIDLLNQVKNSLDALRADGSMSKGDDSGGGLKSLIEIINQNLEIQNERMEKLEIAMGMKRAKSNDNLDNVEELGERLKNLEMAMEKERRKQNVGEAGVNALMIDEDNEDTVKYMECSTNQKEKENNKTEMVIYKLDDYSKRLLKLEQQDIDWVNTPFAIKPNNEYVDIETWDQERNSLTDALFSQIASRINKKTSKLNKQDRSKEFEEADKSGTESKRKGLAKGKFHEVSDNMAKQVNERSDMQNGEHLQYAECSTSQTKNAEKNTDTAIHKLEYSDIPFVDIVCDPSNENKSYKNISDALYYDVASNIHKVTNESDSVLLKLRTEDRAKRIRDEAEKSGTKSKNKCQTGKVKSHEVSDNMAKQVDERSDIPNVDQEAQNAEPSTSRVVYNYNYVDGILTCPQCAQQFVNKGGYSSHMRHKHKTTEKQSPLT